MKMPVAVLKTTPQTYMDDAAKLFKLAGFNRLMDPKKRTVLKINISWQEYFPSCSTSPWQMDAVLNILKTRGFSEIHPVENITVVTDAYKGMETNKLNSVLSKYGLKFECLLEGGWEEMPPSKKFIFGKEDMLLPSVIKNSQVIHLPTLKCHGHSVTTCSMKNAFGFLKTVRHHYHLHIHEILVDLLRIQKEFCKSLFSFADGSIAMDGAGPRTGTPHVKNCILAGGDMVAVDAVAAKIMGFDPMKIGYIKLAHDEGLGIGDIDQIDIVGEDINRINFGFKSKKDPVIYFDRLLRATALEPLLFRTSFFRLVVFASDLYRNMWLKTRGRQHIKSIMKTEWGELFRKY
jgi:uncharacterized protein (DUF362 family)